MVLYMYSFMDMGSDDKINYDGQAIQIFACVKSVMCTDSETVPNVHSRERLIR